LATAVIISKNYEAVEALGAAVVAAAKRKNKFGDSGNMVRRIVRLKKCGL
jgi:hypothetical protein